MRFVSLDSSLTALTSTDRANNVQQRECTHFLTAETSNLGIRCVYSTRIQVRIGTGTTAGTRRLRWVMSSWTSKWRSWWWKTRLTWNDDVSFNFRNFRWLWCDVWTRRRFAPERKEQKRKKRGQTKRPKKTDKIQNKNDFDKNHRTCDVDGSEAKRHEVLSFKVFSHTGKSRAAILIFQQLAGTA